MEESKVFPIQDSLNRKTLLKEIEEYKEKLVCILPFFEDVEDEGFSQYDLGMTYMGGISFSFSPTKSIRILIASVLDCLDKWGEDENTLEKKKIVFSFVVSTLIHLLETKTINATTVKEFKADVALMLLK